MQGKKFLGLDTNELLGCLVGCLVVLGIVLLITWFVVAWVIDRFYPQPVADAFYPVAAKVNFIILMLFVVLFLGTFFLALAYGIMGLLGKYVQNIGITVLIIGILAGMIFLGITYEDSHWIVLNRTGFSQQKVSITEGGVIRFANPATGISQRLCLATHFECIRTTDGPKELKAPGAVIAPGQTLHVEFPTAGDYQIISTSVPAMSLIIHVDVPSSD
jgi:hypothetical protein